MASKGLVSANFGKRLPGKTRHGSQAFYRKHATIEGRQGMAEILKRYSAFIRQLEGATPEILENAMMPAFNKSQEYVPKDTLALAQSGRLTVENGPRPTAFITYGDEKAWYAALVHEYTWLNHEPPTRAKYLQAALEEELDSFLTSLAVDYATMFR